MNKEDLRGHITGFVHDGKRADVLDEIASDSFALDAVIAAGASEEIHYRIVQDIALYMRGSLFLPRDPKEMLDRLQAHVTLIVHNYLGNEVDACDVENRIEGEAVNNKEFRHA